ncbi:MAG: hypothetical protein RML46_10700 [Anaerolineae bacterium]|nr:hypothetical protein [Anaerolineae bacterium]MDW8069374.1 hypothetical protein [Anaerolineae bacterium]
MPWIGKHLQRLDFHTALDAFGGNGVVSYWLTGKPYRHFITETLQGIYYTDEENEWLDYLALYHFLEGLVHYDRWPE